MEKAKGKGDRPRWSKKGKAANAGGNNTEADRHPVAHQPESLDEAIGVPEVKPVQLESGKGQEYPQDEEEGDMKGSGHHHISKTPQSKLQRSKAFCEKPETLPMQVKHAVEDVIVSRTIPVLEPNGLFMRFWRPWVFKLVLIAVIMVPFELSFSWWTPPGYYKKFMKSFDLFFIADMVIHFNTGFVHDDHVIRDRKAIAEHYARSWLLIDCLSNFPWDWFMPSTGKNRKILKFLKLPKILRFVRMLRALKDQWHYVGVGGCLFAILLFAHVCSCLWTYCMVSSCSESSDACPDIGGTYWEGVTVSMSAITGTDSWTRWVNPAGSSRMASLRDAYEKLAGMEEAFATVIMFFGYVALACLFGTVAAAMQHVNERGRTRALMLRSRKQDMRQAKVPWALQRRVEATYELAWLFGDWHDGLFKDETLSLDLRRNLALHVYGPALKAVPMFKSFPDHDLKCLAQKIVSRNYTPGDLIIQVGEPACEIFFIFTGSARPLDKQGNEMFNVLLKKGDFFGEICFLSPGSRRTASVVCIEFCRAMVLTLQVFQELGLEGLLQGIREECLDHMNHYGNGGKVVVEPTTSLSTPKPSVATGATPTKTKNWAKNKPMKETPNLSGQAGNLSGQAGDVTGNWLKAAKDVQLTTIIRMIHELIESVERNAAEVMNRVEMVEERQEELFKIVSGPKAPKLAAVMRGKALFTGKKHLESE